MAIWTNMVLLTRLDSMAVRRRSVWFQRVNTSAVLTTASQRTIPQPEASSLGTPSTISPVARRSSEPTPMLTTVTNRGWKLPWRLTERPRIAPPELASIPRTATTMPIMLSGAATGRK